MKIYFIKKALIIFTLIAVTISCSENQQVGDSLLTPSSPAVSITLSGPASNSFVEDDSVHTYTVTLSEAQVVDVKLHVIQIGGTATSDDYEMTTLVTIPAGYTSASGSIKILSDDLIEDTETLKIQIGDVRTANAALTPVTVDFELLNYTSGDLTIDMSWAMSIATDNAGKEISPTAFADLRLLVSSGPDNVNIVGGADGGSFETYVLSGAQPDGDYYVVADFYDANADIFRDIDLALTFNQPGVINGDSYSYTAALNNATLCPANFFTMIKITKSGDSYTFSDVSTPNIPANTSWSGLDAGFDSQVVTGGNCDGLTVSGLNAGWMLDFWGETVIDSGTILYTVDGAGNVTIANQFLYTTTWNGSVQDNYFIEGTGTLDEAAGTLDIQYKLLQGWDVSASFGEADGFFHARLTK